MSLRQGGSRPWWIWLVLILSLLAGEAGAQAKAGAGFDHLRTGFALTGQHSQTRCESCHQNGVLKGTPRDCVSCHVSGQRFARGNTVMPGNHLPTQQACDACHTTKSFTGIKFNHAGAQTGSCASCHNGSVSTGKSASHVATSASCDACHRSAAWLPLTAFDHSSAAPGSCATCHNGSRATGKSAQHMPTGSASACDSCHKSFNAWRPSAWNHTQTAVNGQCATCHSGGFPPADGKPGNHLPYQNISAAASANCDTCHRGSMTTWANGRFHANVKVSSGCATCHTSGVLAATAKPATPVHNGAGACESCHLGVATWTGAKVDHSVFNASTNCASCHDGTSGTGKPSAHIPVGSTNCQSCHTSTAWKPSKWTHTQLVVAANCASCHSGGYPPADGRSAKHIPYQSVSATASANCDTCHKSGYGAWTPAKFHASVSVTGACATCHTGGFQPGAGKPNTPIHANVSGNCESCHKSTSTWSDAKVDHTAFNASTNCASCHDGSSAVGKPATHMPVGSTNCFSCHATKGWTPAKWNHTQLAVAAKCASCHTGGYPPADGRSATHVPFQSVAATAGANCDTCHKTGFGAWTPAKFHSSVSVTSACATCHTGGFPPADGRSATHIPFQSVPASASANCDTCHKSGFGTWAPAKFHANVSVNTACATCHTGAFPPAAGKPNNALHANVSGNCESCHKSASSWSSAKVDHSSYSAATNCASCHDGSAATGKSSGHVTVGSTNCFSCHGTTGWTPTKFNHTQVAVSNKCASCHTGGYPPADGRSSSHIPYTSVSASASANCDTCHKSGFSTWTPAKFHNNVTVSTACATCHTGGFPPAVGKPNTPVHSGVTGNCESCHKSTSTWSGAKVDHSTFNASTNCASCHDGTSATGKSSTHVPVGSTNCFSCHNTTGWTPSKFNHTQVTVAAKCASCHTGGYPPADGRSAIHIPYQSVSASSSANCDTCHKSGYSTWTPAKFHNNVTVSTACATCHTGSFPPAVGKPNTPVHSGVTGNCESCHKSTSTWSGAKVDHSTFNASTNCASCHDGTTATGKSSTHVPVGSTNCFNCHNTTGWTPSKFNHTQVPVSNKCSSCHTGGYPPADGKSSNHIPYQSVSASSSANCDTCHKSGYNTWTPAKFHSNVSVSTACATCHTGAYPPAVGKPNTPVHSGVTGNCESCHKSTSTWSANVDHSGYNGSTNCASCHNGSSATGKPSTHVPVGSTNCYSCHNTTGWTPSKFNHTQVTVTGQCASCHTGGYPPADGKPGNHIPYQSVSVSSAANCDACHKGGYSTWGNGKFHSYFSVSTSCATCHTGSYLNAVGKPNTPIHSGVTGNCESCHKSTSNWSANVDHSTYNASTNCGSCHNGSTATGKPSTHVPVGSTNCYSCHNTTGWTPTKWNHTQVTVTGQCASCHTGGYPPADGKPGNHIPYQSVSVSSAANCDACHKGSYSTWANGKFHSSFSVSTTCATCHTGTYLNAVGKPNNSTHSKVTGNCESCHKSTTNWNTVTFTHGPAEAVGTGTCDNCHSGAKPGNHIPIPAGTAKCDACHKSQASWATSVTTSHSSVSSATCKSCHGGSYTSQGAITKPSNHIPEVQLLNGAAMDCKACHTSTTSFGTMKMNHNGSQGNGAGWCKSCHASGTNYAGGMEKKSLTHQKSSGVTDCSQSGCHKPLGNKGQAYTKWD